MVRRDPLQALDDRAVTLLVTVFDLCRVLIISMCFSDELLMAGALWFIRAERLIFSLLVDLT